MQDETLHSLANEALKGLNEAMETMISCGVCRLPAGESLDEDLSTLLFIHPCSVFDEEEIQLIYQCPLSTVTRIAGAFLEEEVSGLDEGSLDAINELLLMVGNGLPAAVPSLKLKMQQPLLLTSQLRTLNLRDAHLSVPLDVNSCGRMMFHVAFFENS